MMSDDPEIPESELESLRRLRWEASAWHADTALVDRSGNGISLYVGQSFDPRYFALVPGAWKQELCHLCAAPFSDRATDHQRGFVAGNVWLCAGCFRRHIEARLPPTGGVDGPLLRKKRVRTRDGAPVFLVRGLTVLRITVLGLSQKLPRAIPTNEIAMSTCYTGSCHCGAIGFSFATEIEPGDWSVRACQCSFCRAHGAVNTSDPDGSVRFELQDRDALVRYSFGLRTAEFLLCGNCGVYIAAVLKTDSGAFATVNLRSLAATPSDLAPPEPISYEQESAEQRIARRRTRWTPVEGSI